MRRILITCCLVLILAGANYAQTKAPRHAAAAKPNPMVEVRDASFRSEALSREAKYRILLPSQYGTTARRFPVIYLLHGLYGDFENWETRTDLTRYAEAYQVIIVTPDAGDSWYVNSATVPQDRYEDFIVKDLIPEVDRHWRTIRSPHRRAIAGLSMGGYGAMKFALKYPDMFIAAASLGGAFNAPLDLDQKVPDFRDGLVKVFGPHGSETRSANDVLQLASVAVPADLPYLYVDCGVSDKWFYDINHEFISVLRKRGIRYEYHETPGAHTWEYWDRRLPGALESLSKFITKN